jgi:hypothetical protein
VGANTGGKIDDRGRGPPKSRLDVLDFPQGRIEAPSGLPQPFDHGGDVLRSELRIQQDLTSGGTGRRESLGDARLTNVRSTYRGGLRKELPTFGGESLQASHALQEVLRPAVWPLVRKAVDTARFGGIVASEDASHVDFACSQRLAEPDDVAASSLERE